MNSESLNGVVKWFSSGKGYGFITDENNNDYFFSVQDIVGPTVPKAGVSVKFIPHKASKGPSAKSVQLLLLDSSESTHYVNCKFCGKKIVPRIIFSNKLSGRSACPFCGKTHKRFGLLGRLLSLVK